MLKFLVEDGIGVGSGETMEGAGGCTGWRMAVSFTKLMRIRGALARRENQEFVSMHLSLNFQWDSHLKVSSRLMEVHNLRGILILSYI